MPDADRILTKLDALAEDVTELRVAVARLEERSGASPEPARAPRGLVRAGTMTAAGGAVGAALATLLQTILPLLGGGHGS